MELGIGDAPSFITPSQMASWEFARPKWWHCSPQVDEIATNWVVSAELNNHLLFWSWSLSLVLSYPTTFRNGGWICWQKGRWNTENRVRKHLSCIAQVLLKKQQQLWEIHISWIRASFCSELVTEGSVYKWYCLTKVTGKSIKWTKFKSFG